MPNTFKIYENLKKTFNEDSAKNLTDIITQIYEDVANTVTKVEFKELRDIVSELAEAQKRTELRVEELAEAQKRTELRVEELAEAQKRTELRVEELAEAQKETQQELRDLARQVGGLSMSVGYGIEDKYIPYMDDFVLKQYGIIANSVERRFIEYPDGRYDEVNIFVEGIKDGRKIYVIGESKAQPSKKDFDRFDSMLKRLSKHLNSELQAFMVGYIFAPEVVRYASENYPHIDRYQTYHIERIVKSKAA
jgi:hypothetical protein